MKKLAGMRMPWLKNLLVLLAVVTVFLLKCPFAHAGTLFSDEMESSGWSNWGIRSIEGTDSYWTRFTYTNSTYGGAWFNSGWAASGSASLLYRVGGFAIPATPEIVTLKFWMFIDTVLPGYDDYIQAKVSVDHGDNWDSVGEIFHRYYWTSGWYRFSVNLNAFKGMSDVRIGFLGVSAHGDHIYLDSVSVVTEPPPSVVSTIPASGATGVSPSGSVSATFSKEMKASTLTPTTFYLNNGATGTVTYQYSSYTATFTPSVNLTPNTDYTATISSSVTDIVENQLPQNHTWSFRTGNPSFSVSGPTVTSTLGPGGSTQAAFLVSVADGFNSAVALSASGLPPGMTASFSPATLSAPGSGSSTLTLSTTAATPTGDFTITITGTGGGLTKSATCKVTVTDSYTLMSLAKLGTALVAVGDYGSIRSSADAKSWSSQPSGTAQPLFGVTQGNGKLVAVGGRGTVLTSVNGTAWTTKAPGVSAALLAVAWANGKFVAVGDQGTIVTSSGGDSWAKQVSGTLRPLLGVAGDDTTVVAVGGKGTILTSVQGGSWNQQASGTTEDLTGIASNGTVFVAIGDHGTILTSPDGTHWTRRSSGTYEALLGIAFAGNRFVAVGDFGTFITSADGITWTSRDSGVLDALTGVIGNGSMVICTGDYGTIIQLDPAAATAIQYSVSGKVTTNSAAPIAGATVTIGDASGSSKTVTTAADGTFTKSLGAAGPYSITVTKATYNAASPQTVLLNTTVPQAVLATIVLTDDPAQQLTVNLAGTGGGNINSDANLSCSSTAAGQPKTCSWTLSPGQIINLLVTPDAASLFTGWSGACTGLHPLVPDNYNCRLTMDGTKTVTANFTKQKPVQLNRAAVAVALYDSLQMAYNQAQTGDVIKLLAVPLSGQLDGNRAVVLTVSGGYDASYGSVGTGNTIIGKTTIRNGTVRFNRVKIK